MKATVTEYSVPLNHNGSQVPGELTVYLTYYDSCWCIRNLSLSLGVKNSETTKLAYGVSII